MQDIQLSEHFKLSEFTKSVTADKLGICNEPTDIEIGHLRLLCTYLLEPLCQVWGDAITVICGFTKDASETSAHRLGYAADIVPSNGDIGRFKNIVKYVLKRGLVIVNATYVTNIAFDQCIDERNAQGSEWIHIGLMNAQGEQRRQFLITKDGKNYQEEDKV